MWRSLVCAIAIAAIPIQVQAAEPSNCAPRKQVVNHLAAKFGEEPVAIGVSDSGRLVEILADRAGGTFTVILTTPQGLSCVVLTGESWQARPIAIAEPDA